jgi:glucose-1-phosphate adenylyltransferase
MGRVIKHTMDVMGIINLNEPEDYLHELTQYRPLAAIPFGGRYRLIDFVLSNMVNSGITNVGILMQHKYRSLMDHLRSGKEWDLARKVEGLFLLPPAYSNYPTQMHRGDVENFYNNLDYIERSRQRYVVIAGVNTICNLDYRAAVEYHRQKGADITVLYTEKNCTNQDCSEAIMLDVAVDGRVVDMQVKAPEVLEHQKLSMEMYIMDKSLLVDVIRNCIAHGDYDFIKHCMIKNLDKLKVYGYRHGGYLAHINSIQSYFAHNMDLLKPKIWQELFFRDGSIYTKVKDEPPSKYVEEAEVSNSLVAGGCYIAGYVENSVLFRGVKVHRGACIKNSIIMQRCEISGDTLLENVICDKDVRIASGKQLKGEINYPFVIRKGMVI